MDYYLDPQDARGTKPRGRMTSRRAPHLDKCSYPVLKILIQKLLSISSYWYKSSRYC